MPFVVARAGGGEDSISTRKVLVLGLEMVLIEERLDFGVSLLQRPVIRFGGVLRWVVK
jgi:hypothetical protein